MIGVYILLGGMVLFATAHAAPISVYVGTYTEKNSKGIYRLEMDAATGKLSGKELVAETPNPTFLAVHPN